MYWCVYSTKYFYSQEIRYFSENYDSIKTLEKATEENPYNENLWIRLAMVHMGSNKTEGDRNNNNKKIVDRTLNTLVKALEYNRHSEVCIRGIVLNYCLRKPSYESFNSFFLS